MEAFDLEKELGLSEMESEVKEAKEKVEKIKAKKTSTVEADEGREALSEFLGVKLESVKDIHDEFHAMSNKLDEADQRADKAEARIKKLEKLLIKNNIEFEAPKAGRISEVGEFLETLEEEKVEPVEEESFMGALGDL